MQRLLSALSVLVISGCGIKTSEPPANADKSNYVFTPGDTLSTLEAHIPPGRLTKSNGVGAVVMPVEMAGVTYSIDDDHQIAVYFYKKSQMILGMRLEHQSPSRLKAERAEFEITGFSVASDNSVHVDARFPTPNERRIREEAER